MANKKRQSLGDMIAKTILLVPNLVNIVSNITTLINIESRLTGRTLLSLIVFAVILGTLLVSTWMCVLALLFVWLTSLLWSPIYILLMIGMLNIIMSIIISVVIVKLKSNLLFPATRRTCRNLRKQYQDEESCKKE